jgi:hypothetical protein
MNSIINIIFLTFLLISLQAQAAQRISKSEKASISYKEMRFRSLLKIMETIPLKKFYIVLIQIFLPKAFLFRS